MGISGRWGLARRCSFVFLGLLGIFFDAPSIAQIPDPIRYFEGVPQEGSFRLTRARVLAVDYELLKRDFGLAALGDEQINEWLISNTARIARGQLKKYNRVNTPIDVVPERPMPAYRPFGYGRCLVVPVDDQGQTGLIEVKGAGAASPRQAPHRNGLMTLGEVIREYLYEHLVRDLLKDAGAKMTTVGTYAVIDAGFDVLHADGSSSRAGLLLRQAHARPTPSITTNDYSRKVEAILNRYGVHVDRNLQFAHDGSLVDFGHYSVSRELIADSPISNKTVPWAQWGIEDSVHLPNESWAQSRLDRPWMWSHTLADEISKGRAGPADVQNHLRNMLEPARARWSLTSTIDGAGVAGRSNFSTFKGARATATGTEPITCTRAAERMLN
jgi:hypothetical protein